MDIRPPARRPDGQVPQRPTYSQGVPPQQPVQPPAYQQPVAPQPIQPVQPVPQPQYTPVEQAPPPTPQPIQQPPVKKPRKLKKFIIGLVVLLLLFVAAAAGAWFWYQSQLEAVDKNNTEKVLVVIEEGSNPNVIADVLKDKNVIKNKDAFLLYTRLQGVQDKLSFGSYRLSPSETTTQIVEHLVKGNVDTFSITFYPGATLTDNVTKIENRIDVTSVLLRAGYSEEEIKAALSNQYDHPIFQGKPVTAGLEGYVFGETYEFYAGASVADILTATFDEFYKYVEQDNLIAEFQKQGRTLYQGITLASIVQRESGGDDKAQIAQVFYTRLAMGMPLGSDVTYQYIADKEGNPRDTNYDSPYNTRRYPGLPPGPIAVPGLAALRGAANPAEGDYIYFLSGDDDVTYYGRTLQEHEANIRNHCKEKCLII